MWSASRRNHGRFLFDYFDGISNVGDDPIVCAKARHYVLNVLHNADFCVDDETSDFELSQLILGCIKFRKMRLEFWASQQEGCCQEMGKLVPKSNTFFRQVTRILGKALSLLGMFIAFQISRKLLCH